MPPPPWLLLEQKVARAHRALHEAAVLADTMSLHGTAADLEQLRDEVARCQESLLRGGKLWPGRP